MDAERADLEAKVTFLERTLDAINEAMIDQGRHITRLEARIEELHQKVEAKDAPEMEGHDSRPPHY